MTISNFYLGKNYRVISRFGNRSDPFTGETRQHNGIDYGMPLWNKRNSPYNVGVPTPFKGRIHAVGTYGGRGLTVVQHIEGTQVLILFQHLASTTLRKGTLIEPEDTIGIMGTTGRSTGIHLHLELRRYSSAPLGSGVWGDPDKFNYTIDKDGDKMKTVVLDPGHGGDGSLTKYGATGNGLREKDLVLTVARHTREHLLKNFYCKVVMTRDSDVDVSFEDRADIARKAKADILHSFHFNGYHDAGANGFETFIYSGSLLSETKAYQHTIHNSIYAYLKGFGIRDRGKKSANFAILRLPPTPCILTEYCFLTNPREAEIMKRSGVISRLGIHTAEGIASAIGLQEKTTEEEPPKPPTPEPPKPPIDEDEDIFYRVIVGSYNNRGNADRMLGEAKRKGFDNAFIVAFRR